MPEETPQQTNSNIPPEQLYRQPGALEHGKKNWFALHHLVAYALIGVIGLALVAGAYYYQVTKSIPVYQPPVHHTKSNPTSDWKTFADQKEGYTFKYPENFIVFEDKVTDEHYIYDVNIEPDFVQSNYSSMKVSVEPFISEPFTKQDFEEQLNRDYKIKNSEKLNISGLDAYRFNLQGPSQQDLKDPYGSDTNVYIGIAYPDGGGIEIEFESKNLDGSAQYKQDLAIFDQILSTFKFTDSSTSEDISTWKTYTNKKYGYSIKYPQDWTLIFQEQSPSVSPDQSTSFNLANFKLELPIYNFQSGQIMIFGAAGQVNSPDQCKTGASDYKNGQVVTIDGVKGVKYIYDDQPGSSEGEGHSNSEVISFYKNNICFGLSLSPYPISQELQNQFDQILATFKFTK